jgi:hypothetical protein
MKKYIIKGKKKKVPVKLFIMMSWPYSVTMKIIKSFCGGPGGGFLEKSPLAAGGKKRRF